MPDSGLVSCDELRVALRQTRTLTAPEAAHVEGCDACLEVWLDATVTQALDAKPEVKIPSEFAARIADGLPEKHMAAGRSPQWGLMTAVALVAVGMIALAIGYPAVMKGEMGVVFTALVVTEIAGIALWLGCWPHGRTASRGHSRWS
jgi:hypothetical protein